MRALRLATTVALLTGLLLTLNGCQGSGGGRGPARAQRVVLITVDGLVPSHLGGDGQPRRLELPNYDRMRAGGREWPRAWTTSPMTRPAVATYLTGLAPARHAVVDDLYSIPAAGVTTLASSFEAAGWQTAAFVQSGFLGRQSGLLEEFGVVDEPRAPLYAFQRWVPSSRPSGIIGKNFEDWLATVPADGSYFAWVHLAGPVRSQLAMTSENAQARIEDFDDGLGRLLDAVESRDGDGMPTMVVLGGTFGLVARDPGIGNDPGLGFSVDEIALRVPVVVSGSGADDLARGADEPVWAPDVAATICEAARVDCPDMDGLSLFESGSAERTLTAVTLAPYDQLGWAPLIAARRGDTKVIRGGQPQDISLNGGEPDSTVVRALDDWLAANDPLPERFTIPVDEVSGLLAKVGVTVNAVPVGGRPHPDPLLRDQVLTKLWEARSWTVRRPQAQRALPVLAELLTLDREALAPLVDLGFFELINGSAPDVGRQRLADAAAAYPWSPEALRWFATSIYQQEGRVDTAIDVLRLVMIMRPETADLHYDMACMLSIAGRLDEAEDELRTAIEVGFTDWDVIGSDPDLRALRETDAVTKIIAEFRQ